ncbi:MAG: hypothetical protein ACRC5F_00190, partial [Cetobacterium sp.]
MYIVLIVIIIFLILKMKKIEDEASKIKNENYQKNERLEKEISEKNRLKSSLQNVEVLSKELKSILEN